MSITNLITVISILAPFLEELVEYLKGTGPKPDWFSNLPEKSRSRVEIERLKNLTH